MGQLEKQRAETKSKSRGSVDNGKRLAALKGAAKVGKADWGKADPRWIAAIVILVSSASGAVRFGYSRDGGSYSLGLYLGDETQTLWYNGSEEPDAFLGSLYEELKVVTGE